MVCTSGTWCQLLYNTAGFTSLTLSSTSNAPAACDPGCTTCSTANPQVCSQCMQGFYMTSTLYCAPCSLPSMCSTCSVSNSAICLSCFPGYFLNPSSQCLQCTFPCIACANATATKCTACSIGYVLSVSSNTCILSTDSSLASFGTIVNNCASALLVTASSGSQTLTCSLCLNGFANTNSGCAPCTDGCAVCNPNALTQCINCFPGYSLNSSNLCQACTASCQVCTSLGCAICASGYVLTQVLTCQVPCQTPCASCSDSNPTICTSCVQGYTFTNGQCQVSVSTCISQSSCQTCPYGYSLTTSNSATKLSQTCVQCTAASNCARCNITSPAQCLSCPYGTYLTTSNVCVACNSNCAQCISKAMCLICAPGFVATQSGNIVGGEVAFMGLVNCTACTDNCATCMGSTSTCTSCNSGFTINSGVCISNFNYQVSTTLNVNLASFTNNYVNFINQVAKAAGVSSNNIRVLSIKEGSVTVNMQVNSNAPAGSSNSILAQSNLVNLLKTGGSVADMPVTASSVTTNGGSNTPTPTPTPTPDNGGGLSTTTIIILATVIPIGTLRTY